ncbi:MAG: hypothetical protein RLZZ440_397, partial [Planctomycetota bacterium]
MKGINLGGIGGMLGRNAEKIGTAVIGLVALWLAWGGISALRSKTATTGQSPEAISTLAQQAAGNIEREETPPADRLPPLTRLGPLLDPWRPQQVKIAPSPIASKPLARPLVLAARTKRETPTVFPLEQLHTVAGIAVLEQTGDAAGFGGPGMDRREAGPYGFGAAGGPASPLTPGVVTPYVVVTGLIPAAKQQAEFIRCLGESDGMAMMGGGRAGGGREGGFDRDRPVWTGFRLERQERDLVRGGEFSDWKKLDPPPVADPLGGGRGGEFGGRGGSGDLLPADFRLQDQERAGVFETPLPPRVVEDPPWGPETAHPWFFRQIVAKRLASGPPVIAIDELRKTPEEWAGQTVQLDNVELVGIGDSQIDVGLFRYRLASDDPADEAAEIGETPKLVFAVSDRWGRAMLSGGVRKGPGYSLTVRIDQVYDTPVARILEITKDDDRFLDPDPTSAGEGGMGLGFERRGPMDDGMSGRRGEMFGGEGAEYRSFRFLDTTVEPGKEYRYRVNVSINNPNEGLTPREVADPKTLKVPVLTSEFSEPSDAADVVTTGFLARAMSQLEYASRRTLENIPLPKPKPGAVELLVLVPSEQAGNLLLHKAEAKPGDPIAYAKPADEEEPAAGRSGPRRPRPKKPEQVPTNATLLDFRGEQLTKNENPGLMDLPPEPLEALVLMPNGRFELVSAIDSAAAVRS